MRVAIHSCLTITTTQSCRRCRSNLFLSGKGDAGPVLQHLTISPQLVGITKEPLSYDLLIVFWPDDTTIIPDTASHIDTHDDIAMTTLQTSLAVLQQGSSLATQLPFIAPIAGLLLQALTMRDARVPYNSSDNALMNASPGSETM